MEFTKERLLKIQSWSETYGPGSNVVLPAEEAEELARIALAAQAAGPVYQWRELYKDSDLWDDCTKEQYEGFAKRPDVETRILYTAPPAPVADLLLSELLGIAKRAADEADECAHAEFSDDSMEYSAAIADWERRAAMLQGAAGNSPAIPDGWVVVPIEPTDEMLHALYHCGTRLIRTFETQLYQDMLAAALKQEVK